MARLRSGKKSPSSGEADRYRKAATDTLKLLDWCVQYLAENRQGAVARQVARNRDHIRERIDAASRL
jgi:hypothetical protein